jgi:hypothetical protein
MNIEAAEKMLMTTKRRDALALARQEYAIAENKRRAFILAQVGFLIGARSKPPKFIPCPGEAKL